MLCSGSILIYFFFIPLSLHGYQIRCIRRPSDESDVLAALRAQDVITFSQEAATNQGHRALLTVEAVVVPLALLKGNVLASSEA